MTQPVDFAEDWKVTRADDLEAVTVESIDPDAEAGSDVLDTAEDVTALAGRETETEEPVGTGGVVTVRRRNFTLVAGEVGFEVKSRYRITRADGTKWIVGEVTTGGFGALVVCPDCTRKLS